MSGLLRPWFSEVGSDYVHWACVILYFSSGFNELKTLPFNAVFFKRGAADVVENGDSSPRVVGAPFLSHPIQRLYGMFLFQIRFQFLKTFPGVKPGLSDDCECCLELKHVVNQARDLVPYGPGVRQGKDKLSLIVVIITGISRGCTFVKSIIVLSQNKMRSMISRSSYFMIW